MKNTEAQTANNNELPKRYLLALDANELTLLAASATMAAAIMTMNTHDVAKVTGFIIESAKALGQKRYIELIDRLDKLMGQLEEDEQ